MLVVAEDVEEPDDAREAVADTPLRIVTFNAEMLTAPRIRVGKMQKYRGDVARRAQFERVAAVVEAINPDVLNLIEVTSREGVNLLVKILHEKGLADFRGYHIDSNDNYSGMDVALLSKIEPDAIGGRQIHTFHSDRDDPTWQESYRVQIGSGPVETRRASLSRHAVYYLTVDGYKLGFLGLHLKANPSSKAANAQRTAQSKIALRILQQEIVRRGYMPVVLGDINDYDPDVADRDETRGTLTTVVRDLKNFDADQQGDELVNVASLMPRQADRYTSFWDRNENRARDPHDVFTMIDHIFLPKELMPFVKRAYIFHSIALETSDHRPVVVDLVLPGKEQ